MAVELNSINYNTGYAQFSVDSESDLTMLPKTNINGKGKLATISSVCQGSFACGTNGVDYILNGSNKWVKYIPIDNSISTYNKFIGSFVYEFYMTNVNIIESGGMYFGNATFVGVPTYDYIYRVADMIAKKNNKSTTDIMKTDLVKKTYGFIQWIRKDSNIFPFFNTVITMLNYNQQYADPLRAQASVQFCSTVPLSDITDNNTNKILVNAGGSSLYTCYPFKGMVTVVSQ